MSRSAEARVAELGLVIPDHAHPPLTDSSVATGLLRRSGRILTIGGTMPEGRDGTRVNPGRVGVDVTLEEGYAAAQYAALNVLGLIRLALGSLDEVTGFVRTLTFVAVGRGFTDINKVTNGAADLWVQVFGDAVGRSTSAGIGVSSLPRGNVFQITASVQTRTAVPVVPREHA